MNNESYYVWNETDGFPASDRQFGTESEATDFIKRFRSNLSGQGYYLNSSMERIPLDQVRLIVVPHNVINKKTKG